MTYKFFVHEELDLEGKTSELKDLGSVETMGEGAEETAEEVMTATVINEDDDLLDPKLEENGR